MHTCALQTSQNCTRLYRIRSLGAHVAHTKSGWSAHAMPTFTKLKSGSWRVQVRRKNEYAANKFVRRRDAEEWAIDVERSIDRGTPIRRSRPFEQPRIFSDLIALHLDDLSQVGKPVRRSKSMVLKALKISLGRVNLKDITREKLIEFGRKRASEGAGPATLPAAQV